MKIEKDNKNIFYRFFVTTSMMNYLNFEFFPDIFMYSGYYLIAYGLTLLVCFIFNAPHFVYTGFHILFLVLLIIIFLSYFSEIHDFIFNKYEFRQIFFKKNTLNIFYKKLQQKSVKLIIFQSILIHLVIFIIIVMMIMYGLYMLFWGITSFIAMSFVLNSIWHF